MNTEARACDLCSLPVVPPGFPLQTTSGLKVFCCEGCQGIYGMLHESEVLTDDAAGRSEAADLPRLGK